MTPNRETMQIVRKWLDSDEATADEKAVAKELLLLASVVADMDARASGGQSRTTIIEPPTVP